MKKFIILALLAVTSCLVPAVPIFAQQQGSVSLDPAEYNAYQNAIGQTDPAARAATLESFLQTYPNTKIKQQVLETLVTAYQQAQNPQKALDAADRLLAVDPNNLRGLVTEAGLKRFLAISKNPPDQAMLDQAAAAAQKGLQASKPADMSAADFTKEQKDYAPIFEDAIGVDDANKKDYANAIKYLTQVLKDTPPEQATQGTALQDMFLLAQAYVSQNPPDTLTGAFYYARVSALAPQATDILKNAQYYYRKYHGNLDGFEAFQATAKANAFPPANLSSTVTPAPKPADIANQLVASTPDLTQLALTDREFIMVNGSQESADKVWDSMKGKTSNIQGVVINATPDAVQLAVSDDATQSKTADYTIKLATPLKTLPALQSQVTYIATYDSYTKSPFMITMVDGKSPEKPKPAAHRPVHH
jgi:tetratricopeptide (TPR) repeat protein